ncbi:SpaH/EbpB family LPXTG-anchored major pilin [Glutamicibacter arilaitensis]|uniref:SpaH/EbpB family LPXTG-anchored major pilin n=1 Tax=Glutamicibacter arilaitensis TaxID=256701 RepID=UPI003FD49268
MKPLMWRGAAALGAATLVAGGMMALGAPALAAVGPDQPNAPTEGTLTINKYSGAPVGEGESPDPANLLDGVEFTVTQVGTLVDGVCEAIDLTDAGQWEGLESLFASAPAAPTAPYCATGTSFEQATEDGQTKFNLNLGIYFVQETDPGDNNIVSKVPNFYVSIPTSEGDGGSGWNYDVVADPKNQLMEAPTKSIDEDPSNLVVGSEITWNMTVPVPSLNNGEKFDTAVITDNLDSRLDYVEGSTVASVGGTSLDDGTHFNVSDNAVWTFTPEGREILDANMGQDLVLSFDTTVTAVGNGIIPNPDYQSSFNGTEVPGTPVPYTYWGQLDILKTDNSATPLMLEGAEFQVFDLADGATCPADAPQSGAVSVGESDDNGVVKWGAGEVSPLGLFIGNFNEQQTNPTAEYCVYETVVPAGHVATQIDNPVTISTNGGDPLELTVVNSKKDGPDLPLTGAQGTILMTAGGLAIAAVGAAVMFLARRRRHQQDA